jgi:putative exosortase-associated protein (TIGR04073 family)
MKKVISGLLVAIMILSLSSLVYAKGPGDKLVRGTANILSGWLEIPQTIDEEWKASKNAGIGIVAGLFKGIVLAAGRMASGVWDVLTFPAPVPENYEPLFKPDYVFGQAEK